MQIVHLIHVQCQGRKTTAGDVSSWVNTLILTLTAVGQNIENAEAMYECVKIVTIQELRLDLPQLHRENRIARSREIEAVLQVAEEQIRTFYKDLYSLVMETGAKALLYRYSKNDLDVVELLRQGMEDMYIRISMSKDTQVIKIFLCVLYHTLIISPTPHNFQRFENAKY